MWREEAGITEMLITYIGEYQAFYGWSSWRSVLVDILSCHEAVRRQRIESVFTPFSVGDFEVECKQEEEEYKEEVDEEQTEMHVLEDQALAQRETEHDVCRAEQALTYKDEVAEEAIVHEALQRSPTGAAPDYWTLDGQASVAVKEEAEERGMSADGEMKEVTVDNSMIVDEGSPSESVMIIDDCQVERKSASVQSTGSDGDASSGKNGAHVEIDASDTKPRQKLKEHGNRTELPFGIIRTRSQSKAISSTGGPQSSLRSNVLSDNKDEETLSDICNQSESVKSTSEKKSANDRIEKTSSTIDPQSALRSDVRGDDSDEATPSGIHSRRETVRPIFAQRIVNDQSQKTHSSTRGPQALLRSDVLSDDSDGATPSGIHNQRRIVRPIFVQRIAKDHGQKTYSSMRGPQSSFRSDMRGGDGNEAAPSGIHSERRTVRPIYVQRIVNDQSQKAHSSMIGPQSSLRSDVRGDDGNDDTPSGIHSGRETVRPMFVQRIVNDQSQKRYSSMRGPQSPLRSDVGGDDSDEDTPSGIHCQSEAVRPTLVKRIAKDHGQNTHSSMRGPQSSLRSDMLSDDSDEETSSGIHDEGDEATSSGIRRQRESVRATSVRRIAYDHSQKTHSYTRDPQSSLRSDVLSDDSDEETSSCTFEDGDEETPSGILSQRESFRRTVVRRSTNDCIIRNFACNICTKAFRTDGDRRRHEYRHTASRERPYPCSYCSKSFYEDHHKQEHERIHTGERPFACRYCPKSFIHRKSKVYHERLHKGEKPYKCSYCPRRFYDSTGKVIHERTHTGEKPFSCRYCSMPFSRKTSKEKHEFKHRTICQRDDGSYFVVFHPVRKRGRKKT